MQALLSLSVKRYLLHHQVTQAIPVSRLTILQACLVGRLHTPPISSALGAFGTLNTWPGNSALCGSRPLVTPYYCRLGDLLCFVFMSAYCMSDFSVYYLFLQYFDTVGWVFWPVKTRLPYNLYCVGGDVKHCSIQSNEHTDPFISFWKVGMSEITVPLYAWF